MRHSLNASYVWELPIRSALRGRGPKSIVNGWQLAGTVFARTGFPYTVLDFFASASLAGNNFFGPIYAVPVAPIKSSGSCGNSAAIPNATKPCLPPETLPSGAINPGALFVQPGCETGFDTGNLPSASDPCGGRNVSFAQGRNRFRGPHYFNTDFSLTKNTKLPRWEGGRLGIGIQFYNLFNHPNFGLPDAGLPSPTFGNLVYSEAPPTTLLGSGLGGDASGRMIELRLHLQF